MKKYYLLLGVCFLTFSSLLFNSCTSIKNYKYFEDISDTARLVKIPNSYYHDPVIQNDDILYIAIQTLDPLAGNSINAINNQTTPGSNISSTLLSANAMTGNQASVYGYLIDKQGMVTIPVLGKVSLAGLTTSQARETLTVKASKFYKDASVIVRFANFKITVLGEVERPGTYTVPNEKITLLDALGYAGDLTIYGKRENVLLLRREADGSTIATRLNLNNSSVIRSPYFYLQQNDEIYVEPKKTKITASDAAQARNITIITSALTVLIVLLTRIK